MDWRGYPALRNDILGLEPLAVAWLDGDLWLHHALRISETDGARDVLTLIVPRTCGHGHADIQDLLSNSWRVTHVREPRFVADLRSTPSSLAIHGRSGGGPEREEHRMQVETVQG